MSPSWLMLILVIGRSTSEDVTTSHKLSWMPASSGACICNSLSATSTILQVPASYSSPTGMIKLFVKRYKTSGSTAITHLIMVSGGPGQSEVLLENHVQKIADYLGGTVAIYLADPRGVGQSQSSVSPGDFSFIDQIESVARNSPIPLGTITLTNTAKDLLQLAYAIKESPEWDSGSSKLNLFGVSFGGAIGLRMLQLEENVFDNAMFDSSIAFEGIFSPDNDENVLENCNNHPYCREQFSGDAKNVRRMMNEILDDPLRNGCTKKLNEYLDTKTHLPQRIYRLYELLLPLLEGFKSLGPRNHSVQLAMAFIKATHLCMEPEKFPDILDEVKRGGGSEVVARGGDANKMNMLVNHLLYCGEAFNLPSGGSGGACGPPTLCHQCMLYYVYQHNYQAALKKYTAPRDPIWNKKPTGKTKIFYVHGKIDLMTPFKPTARLANSMNARLIAYENEGHSIITNGKCARPIFREAFMDDSSRETDNCLSTINSVPLDWTFSKLTKYRLWFDPKINPTSNYIEDPPEPSIRGGSSGWILIIIALVTILVVAVTVYIWKKRSSVVAS